MRRLALQHRAIERLGFVQPALLVKGSPLLERAVEIGGLIGPPTLA